MIRRAGLLIAVLLILASESLATGPEKAIHAFQANPGATPFTGVIEDSAGNLFGTTISGGGKCFNGCGTVFEISPIPGGGWSFKTIYVFQSSADGYSPWGPLLLGSDGIVYGTTYAGGAYDKGTVFDWNRDAVQDFKATERFADVANLHGRHTSPSRISKSPRGDARSLSCLHRVLSDFSADVVGSKSYWDRAAGQTLRPAL